MTKQDDNGVWWFERDGKWLPCTVVELTDGRIEVLQATEEEVLSGVYPV